MTTTQSNILTPGSREERITRILVVALVVASLCLGVFIGYGRWMSSQLLAIGSENVEAIGSEVGALFNEIAGDRFRELRFMHAYMGDTAETYEDRAAIIQEYREEIGFTYYYLLDDKGNYTSARGGDGNFGFGAMRLAYLNGQDESLLDAVLPSGEKIILFVIRVAPIVYEDHTYTAMAFAYNEKDLGEVLRVDAFDGLSHPFIADANGRIVMTSDMTASDGGIENILTYIDDAWEIDGATVGEMTAAFKNQEIKTCEITERRGDFYLSFRPLGFQDYMLVSFTPAEAVEGSIETIRFDTVAMIGLELGLVFALALFGIGIHYTRNLRRKNEQIESRDALILDKEEEIEEKDARLVVQNARLEQQNTQLETALATAEAANQAKSSFLSNVSHDIRTPMNAVIGFATLAEKEIDDTDKVREYLNKIQDSSHHLLGLINEVLDFSKIESGKTALAIDNLNIQSVVERVDSILRQQMLDKGQTFVVDMNDVTPCIVEADELHLTQILVNILTNANKYTPEGGMVELRISNEVEEHLAGYTFVVRDNGVGMSQEYLEHLYDPFTREEASTTNKVPGTGLGMAITRNLVELMGGSIDVTSEKGVGTTFTIRIGFRLVQALGGEADDGAEDGQDLSIEGLHILVAEDNELNAELIVELLRIEGCTCEIARNGRLCVETYMSQPMGTYDVILMDVQMPEMNGYEAARAIRAAESGAAESGAAHVVHAVPIIAMTANAFNEDKRDALDAGMDAHVAKPVDMQVLKRAIHDTMKL